MARRAIRQGEAFSGQQSSELLAMGDVYLIDTLPAMEWPGWDLYCRSRKVDSYRDALKHGMLEVGLASECLAALRGCAYFYL